MNQSYLRMMMKVRHLDHPYSSSVTLQKDYATARRAKTYRLPMVYFIGLFSVSPSIGCYSRSRLPTFNDVRNCEETMWGFYGCCDEWLCVLIKDVCKKMARKRCMMGVRRNFCMSACIYIFVCRFVWDCRHNLMIYGGIFVWCDIIYVKTQVVWIHWFILSRTKQFDKRAVFLHVIESGVRSHWKYICV